MKKKLTISFIIALFITLIGSTAVFADDLGTYSWEGVWDSSFDELTIVQNGNTISGTYTYDNGRIEGTVSGNKATGRWYEDGNQNGTFEWTMSADGKSYTGTWDGSGTWNGTRITSVKYIENTNTPPVTPPAVSTPDIKGKWYSKTYIVDRTTGQEIKIPSYDTLEIRSLDSAGNVTALYKTEFVDLKKGHIYGETPVYGTFYENVLHLNETSFYTSDNVGFTFCEFYFEYTEDSSKNQKLKEIDGDIYYTRNSYESDLNQDIKDFENNIKNPTTPGVQTGELLLQIGRPYMDVCGEPVPLDAAPIIYNSRTMLPIRAVVEALGGTVGWNAQTQRITMKIGSTEIVMTLGSTTCSVNGKNITMDVAPFVMNSRTLVPLRFVSDNIPGCQTVWHAESSSVSILF